MSLVSKLGHHSSRLGYQHFLPEQFPYSVEATLGNSENNNENCESDSNDENNNIQNAENEGIEKLENDVVRNNGENTEKKDGVKCIEN